MTHRIPEDTFLRRGFLMLTERRCAPVVSRPRPGAESLPLNGVEEMLCAARSAARHRAFTKRLFPSVLFRSDRHHIKPYLL